MSVNNHNTAHRLSPEDEEFRHRVENGQFPLAEFNHLAHLQLAYCYLLNQDVVGALDRYRQTVKRLLELNNKDPGKYHETLTCAWLMTVSQRMLDALHVRCFGEFIRLHGDLTDVGLIQ
ncbi:hypothetical protein [Bowmanella dokdonensis]|uniref:Uncharacterized protein n=1 Tax=Bowmanella dokdonensis TaxID=751969 RepID=A0A939DNF0_9ALTE|nr:hypothetical protein [Bowmanella dokdonensis]MBN7825417.1 hypothetical protein [Bowmanella dokdonensis]